MKKLILIAILSLTICAQTAAPTLTELEQLKLRLLISERRNVAYRIDAAQREYVTAQEDAKRLDKEEADWLEAVKAAHPGYQFSNGKLARIEPPKPEPTPPKK